MSFCSGRNWGVNSKAVPLTTAENCPTPQRKAVCRPPSPYCTDHVEGTSPTQVCDCSYTMGQPSLHGCLRLDHHSTFSAHMEGVASSPTCLTCLSGSLLPPDICFCPPVRGFDSPTFTTSPCPFSPSPSCCEVRILCLRHLGLLPWKQGRIKAGARSAGIRPLRYLSSRLSWLPQGGSSQQQTPQLSSRRAQARNKGVPEGRHSQPTGTSEQRNTCRGGEQRVTGPRAHVWSPALSGPEGQHPERQPRGGAAGLPRHPRQLCCAPAAGESGRGGRRDSSSQVEPGSGRAHCQLGLRCRGPLNQALGKFEKPDVWRLPLPTLSR